MKPSIAYFYSQLIAPVSALYIRNHHTYDNMTWSYDVISLDSSGPLYRECGGNSVGKDKKGWLDAFHNNSSRFSSIHFISNRTTFLLNERCANCVKDIEFSTRECTNLTNIINYHNHAMYCGTLESSYSFCLLQ